MSADNWAICPRCESNAELQALAPVVDSEQFRTFREDYEFYGADVGEVHAVYSGRCTVCGISAKIDHSYIFWNAP